MRESEQQSTACRDGGGGEREDDERFLNGDDATGDSAGDRGSSGDGAGGGSSSPLLKALLDNFLDPCLEKTLERLDSVLTDSTSYTKNPAALRHEVDGKRGRRTYSLGACLICLGVGRNPSPTSHDIVSVGQELRLSCVMLCTAT